MEEKGIETWQKTKKQAKNVFKKYYYSFFA